MFKPICLAALTVTLAGCALGIDGSGQGPRASAEVDRPAEAVLDTAQAQALQCLTGNSAYEVQRVQGQAGQGSILVRAPFTTNDMARVDVTTLSANRSKVDIVMWGRSIWDASAVRAMQDAVTFGVTSCKAYMPVAAPRQTK